MNSPATVLRACAYSGNLTVVQHLLVEGVDPNVADQRGRTALSLASGQGHITVVEALLSGGAWVDPHEDYDVYETPLMTAACNGHLEVVKMLVQAGANTGFHVGVSQRTAEAYARCNGHESVADYLANCRRQS